MSDLHCVSWEPNRKGKQLDDSILYKDKTEEFLGSSNVSGTSFENKISQMKVS